METAIAQARRRGSPYRTADHSRARKPSLPSTAAPRTSANYRESPVFLGPLGYTLRATGTSATRKVVRIATERFDSPPPCTRLLSQGPTPNSVGTPDSRSLHNRRDHSAPSCLF